MQKIYPDKETLNKECPSLLKYCEELPDSFNRLGTVLYAKRNTIRKVTLDGRDFVVKCYKRPNPLASIGYGLQKTSKARKAYLNGLELVKRGFRTPMPYAAVEIWKGLWLKECYYICGVCDAETDLAETLNKPELCDPYIAEKFATYVAELHKAGIMMIDLNSTNVLFNRQDLLLPDAKKWFQLIDINRMKFKEADKGETFSLKQRLENLTRFTGRMDVFEMVAKYYVAASKLPQEVSTLALKRKETHDRRWRMRKKFFHPIKNRHYK